MCFLNISSVSSRYRHSNVSVSRLLTSPYRLGFGLRLLWAVSLTIRNVRNARNARVLQGRSQKLHVAWPGHAHPGHAHPAPIVLLSVCRLLRLLTPPPLPFCVRPARNKDIACYVTVISYYCVLVAHLFHS